MPTEHEPAKAPKATGAPNRKPWTPPRLDRVGSILQDAHGSIGTIIESGPPASSPASTS